MGKTPSDSGAKSYNYFGSIAGVVCEGPVNELLAIICDSKTVWPKAVNWIPGLGVSAGELRIYGGLVWRCILNHTACSDPTSLDVYTWENTTFNAPPNPTYWEIYSFVATGDYDIINIEGRGDVWIYWGTQTQVADPVLSSSGNEYGEQHPSYRGLCYVVLKNFLFGQEKQSAPNVEIVVRRKPVQDLITGDPANLLDGQANPAAIVAELMRSDTGMSLPATAIDAGSLQTLANAAQGNQKLFPLSKLIDAQDSPAAALTDIVDVLDAWFRWDPVTKLITCGQYVHGVDPPVYVTLTKDHLCEPPKLSSSGWAEVQTRCCVQFSDRMRAFKTSSDKVDDLRAFRVLQEHRIQTESMASITRRAQARSFAAERLKTYGTPRLQAKVTARREMGRDCIPGSYVLIDIDLEPGGAQLYQFFRVKEREIPARGGIDLTLESDASFSPIPYGGTETPTIGVDNPVTPVAHLRICECPSKLSDTPMSLLALAERPGPIISGFHLYYDPATGGDFLQLGGGTIYPTRATLRSNHNYSTTTLEISAPAQVDLDRLAQQPGTLGANEDTLLAILVEIDSGQVKLDDGGFSWIECCSVSASAVGSGTNYDLTILRGRQGTIARAFTSAHAEVWILPRSAIVPLSHVDFLGYRANRSTGASPDSAFFRFAPFTYVAERDLADCTSVEVRFPASIQRGPRVTITDPATNYVSVGTPYPADVQVTGTASDPDGNLISWKILKRLSTVATEDLIREQIFPPTDSADFDVTVPIEGQGTWFIIVRAFDNYGLVSEQTLIISAATGGPTCALPIVYADGIELAPNNTYSGNPIIDIPGHIEFIRLKCTTPGVAMKWSQQVGSPPGAPTLPYIDTDPRTWPFANGNPTFIKVRSTKSGLTDSADLLIRFVN